MSSEQPGWVATRRDNLYLLTKHSMFTKLFDLDLENRQFSIIKQGRRTVLGELLAVDMSPEALIEGLDIQEGDRLLVCLGGRRGVE